MLNRTQARLICALGLLTLLASGCSRQETAKTLARRLSEADRVTITDAGRRAFTMQLTAEEANRLVQAVATAEEESPTVTASRELVVRFFKGTNVLGEFNAGVRVFAIDHGPDPHRPGLRRVTPYTDKSGTLEMLGQKFWHQAATAAQTNQIRR